MYAGHVRSEGGAGYDLCSEDDSSAGGRRTGANCSRGGTRAGTGRDWMDRRLSTAEEFIGCGIAAIPSGSVAGEMWPLTLGSR